MIDAFHIVNHGEIAVRFFTDERTSRRKGVRLTDELSTLRTTVQWRNLEPEVEARWRLVEAAWELNLPREALTVKHDPELLTLFPDKVALRRTSITGSRDALNGYQRGKCFYCFADIAVDAGAHELADVDHFFPHVLKRFGIAGPVDGVWNLVLACRDCNRGVAGKFGRLPALRYLARLWRRNNHLIGSHHPLRDTLLQQTGRTEATRHSFFQSTYNEARSVLIHTWSPQYEFEPAF